WTVHEDTLYTLDQLQVDSNDEGVGSTVYRLYIDGVLWAPGYEPNGADGGTVIFNTSTGQIDWESTNADVTIDTGGAQVRVPYQFTIEVDDGNGGVVSTTMPVDVTNEATVIGNIPDQVITEDSHLTVPGAIVTATDEQVGPGTYYELEINGSSLATWNANNGTGSDIVFNTLTGQIDWDPNNADVGSYTFLVTHYDHHNTSSSDTFQVTVNNNAPSLNAPATWQLHEDDGVNHPGNPSLWTLDQALVDSNDEGVGPTEYNLCIDGVLWTPGYRPNGPDGGTVVFNSSTGEIQWQTTNADVTIDTGGAQFRVPYQFTIEVNDGHGGTVTRTIDVDVTNEVTVIDNIPDQVIQEDGLSLNLEDFAVNAIDEQVGPGTFYTLAIQRDGDSGFQDVTAYNSGNGPGSDIVFDPTTGSISWATTNRDVGHYTFRVTHHDGHQSASPDDFGITVQNNDPVFTTQGPEGETIRATLWFSYDPNTTDESQHDWRGDDSVTYSLVQAPPGMVIDSTTGFVQWRTDPAYSGDVTITIMVSDGNGGFATQSFTIVVTRPTDDLPFEIRFPEDPYMLRHNGTHYGGLGVLDIGEPHQETPMGIIGADIPLPMPGGGAIEDILRTGYQGLDAMLQELANHHLQQPVPEHHGSIPPITPLYDYAPEVFKGKRIYFGAEEVALWESMEELNQPSLNYSGSLAPDTPLEGFAQGIEAGRRLNFSYFPIEEAQSLRLDDLRIADLLGL
ncbi:MAG: hypothetical protein HY912_11120, partial [Desulfomonile tiedjei]|nr:hypothetical protein [Desulfomonile tiedjei]